PGTSWRRARCLIGAKFYIKLTSPAHSVSKTEASGSSQNDQIAEPRTSKPAATMNGAAHEPNWAKTPKTNEESAPPMLPARCIVQARVPEYLLQTSMGTAQDGPMVHSRKNMAAVKQ